MLRCLVARAEALCVDVPLQEPQLGQARLQSFAKRSYVMSMVLASSWEQVRHGAAESCARRDLLPRTPSCLVLSAKVLIGAAIYQSNSLISAS